MLRVSIRWCLVDNNVRLLPIVIMRWACMEHLLAGRLKLRVAAQVAALRRGGSAEQAGLEMNGCEPDAEQHCCCRSSAEGGQITSIADAFSPQSAE